MEVEMARFDLTDFEWSVIQPLLPNKPRGVARVEDGPGRPGVTFRSAANHLREPLQQVAQGGRLGSAFGGGVKGLRWRHPDDRLILDPRASARRQRPKKEQRCGCLGRS